MSPATLWVEGIGLWAPRLPGWEAGARILRGEEAAPASPAPRPAPQLLAPTERRRAPDTVAIALEVAAQACAHATRDPKTLPSVFASTYGDLAVADSICETIARSPELTSPTKFHNSVHNAAAGYWAIATGCQEAYSAVAAQQFTFAEGLLSAAAQALADLRPMLLVAYDIEGRGPLGTLSRSKGAFACALVLAPERTARARSRLAIGIVESEGAQEATVHEANAALIAGNAMSCALPLFEALARGAPRRIVQRLSGQLALSLELTRS